MRNNYMTMPRGRIWSRTLWRKGMFHFIEFLVIHSNPRLMIVVVWLQFSLMTLMNNGIIVIYPHPPFAVGFRANSLHSCCIHTLLAKYAHNSIFKHTHSHHSEFQGPRHYGGRSWLQLWASGLGRYSLSGWFCCVWPIRWRLLEP